LKKITYITDLENKPGGGGSYAVNWHIQDQLQNHFDLFSPRPIVPAISYAERLTSQIQRYIFKKPSNFFYFSPSTLNGNAKKAASHFGKGIDAVFFRSATRWCHCAPPVPYFVYLDIVFHTFFENTFDKKNFLASDLNRIYQAEANFLENASAVFFESDWGLCKAREAYSLKGDHYLVAGRGGVLEPPERDEWTSECLILVSIAMNFEQKGGDIILTAFKDLKKSHPALRWHIIGGQPTGDWKAVDGIVYEGLLNPDDQTDLARYRSLLSQAFLLMHPTREDATPLVLTEAAYFGCPSVSVNRFAIPELVIDGKTGILLDYPAKPEQLLEAVKSLIEAPEIYRQMRHAAFEFSRSQFDWHGIGHRMAETINSKLA
jgi:glycosyltransferase involved in cell wall biosynthesis